MQKIISAKKVGKNTYKRIVNYAFTKDELVIIIIGLITIAYITIRSLL